MMQSERGDSIPWTVIRICDSKLFWIMRLRPSNDQLAWCCGWLIERFAYDPELAGAALAGEDGCRLASAAILARLHGLITSARFIEALAKPIRGSQWFSRPELLPRVHAVLLSYRDRLLQ